MVPFPNALLLRSQSDERLVALAQAGSERAFEAIVERYRRQLGRVARQLLPESRAEDAVQQALVAAWTALSRGDDVRELRPWLQRVARNAALNQLRISGYDHDELPELLTSSGSGPHEELERRLGVRRTLAGVAALPERQREALLDIAVHGRGQDAVARELGLSEGAVRQLVHRARVRLRATATALTPMPLAGWAAATADSGAGGAAVTVAKVGVAAVLAGGAAAGPVLVIEHRAQRPEPRAAAQAAARPAPAAATPAASSPRVVPAAMVLAAAPAPSRATAPTRRRATGGSDVQRTNGAPGAPAADDRSGGVTRRGEDGHARGGDHARGPGGRERGDDHRGSSGDDSAGDRAHDDDAETAATLPAASDDHEAERSHEDTPVSEPVAVPTVAPEHPRGDDSEPPGHLTPDE